MKLRVMKNDIELLRRRIGSRVRASRRAKNLTQEQLAVQVGRTTEAISNIERAASLPPLDTLSQISDALEVDLLTFLKGEGSEQQQRSRREVIEAEILATVALMEDDTAETALKLVKALKPSGD